MSYSFPAHPAVTFHPRAGHLRPNSSRDITVTFLSTIPVSLVATPLPCSISQISMAAVTGEDKDIPSLLWDSNARTVEWIVEEDSNGRLLKRDTIVPCVEPIHVVLDGTSKDMPLFCSVTTAYSLFQCSQTEICFDDTLLFQRRTASFPLKNIGLARFEYTFTLVDDALDTPHTCVPFHVEPVSGVLLPAEEIVVVVTFAPLEDKHFAALLSCKVLLLLLLFAFLIVF